MDDFKEKNILYELQKKMTFGKVTEIANKWQVWLDKNDKYTDRV